MKKVWLIIMIIGLFTSCKSSTDRAIEKYEQAKEDDRIDSLVKHDLQEAKRPKEHSMDSIELIKWEKTKAGKIHKKHPEWNRAECELIANDKIWIGMRIDMVIYEFGRNFHRNVSNYGDGTKYQYCWHDYESPSCFYTYQDSIVYAYN